MNNRLNVFLLFILFLTRFLFPAERTQFIESFVNAYDIEEKYTHEYHPFIRNKTGKSLLLLEKTIADAGFIVDGRFTIFGFQEDAFPPYTTDMNREAIDDEAFSVSKKGIGKTAKNIFGFYTAAVLGDIEYIERYFKKEPSFSFSSAKPLELLEDNNFLLKEHAFGKNYTQIKTTRDTIEKAVIVGDYRHAFEALIAFWEYLYLEASKSGSQETVATQDILFSIEYLKSLNKGNVQLKKFFIGPDITYPIEVLSIQTAEATAHAQKFIKKISADLTTSHNQKTGYIFCSFVDGVGKSTLFGNLQNYMRYGEHVENYQRCNNSSSQEATIIEIKKDIFIIDLPAQVSHFAIKPEGFVYADLATGPVMTKTFLRNIAEYIKEHKNKLIGEFQDVQEKALRLREPLYAHPEDIAYTLAQNVVTLKKSSEWIPFRYEGYNFVFSKKNPSLMRVLVPLSGAHSTALKTIEPELMLFTKGMTLPMPFDCFLTKLIDKMKEAEIQRVVFVDFLSMYPRTSRENIRINFMLQYIKHVYEEKYDIEKSFYKETVNGEGELYHIMHTYPAEVTQNLSVEAAFRAGLFSQFSDNQHAKNLTTLQGPELAEKLKQEKHNRLAVEERLLLEKAEEKIKMEHDRRIGEYTYNKNYESIIRFDFKPLLAFSDFLIALFSQPFLGEQTQMLWQGLEGDLLSLESTKKIQGLPVYKLSNGTEVFVNDSLDEECRDPELLTPFFTKIRCQWYFLISGLLEKEQQPQQGILCNSLSMALKRGPDGKIYSVSKSLPFSHVNPYEEQSKIAPSLKFYLSPTLPSKSLGMRTYGIYNKRQYCLNWFNLGTYFWLFSFGNFPIKLDLEDERNNIVSLLVANCKERGILKDKPDRFLSITEFFTLLSSHPSYWEAIEEWKQKTIKSPIRLESQAHRIPKIQLWLRSIATLEIICKDPKSDMLVRKGDKMDFILAVKLLEKITLPLYFNITHKEALFSHYEQIQPVIPWENII